ncbi:MAG: hypothetical protein ABI432_09465 [Flavobacteriales bacterium]
MNQRIDHSNYEAWLLDRLEGNLTPEQERELDAFLAQHPELVPEEGELPTLNDSTATLSAAEKGSLKRNLPPSGIPSATTIDDHLVARLEGDLTLVQLDALRAYLIDHPEHQRAERIYALTKIVPAAMAYAAKQALQRNIPPVGLPTRHTMDDFLVARLERDLTREQEAALSQILAADPIAQKSWRLMNATRVDASAIAYPEKSALKKGGRVIAIGSVNWTVRLAAAASVAAIIGLGLWFLLQRAPEGPQVAETPKKSGATQKIPPQQDERVRPNDVKLELNEGAIPTNTPGSVQERKSSGTDSVPAMAPANEPAPRNTVPVDRNETLPLAEHRAVVPAVDERRDPPANVPVPEVPPIKYEELPTAATAPAKNEMTVAEMLTATVRERVLDRPARETQALDRDDAVAAVDKGLKAVGGDRAGLAVDRKADGGLRGFNLRLGRNLAISASR